MPQAVQDELEQQGLTAEEARAQARRLGIDLSDPQQAAQQARELGLPEARIQALLSAVEQEQPSRETARPQGPSSPILAAPASVDPRSVAVARLPQRITMRIPLRSGTGIRDVEPFFITVAGDTVEVDGAQRVEGSVTDGVWGADFMVPRPSEPGPWMLLVRVVDGRGQQSTLLTNTRLMVGKADTGDRGIAQDRRDSLPYFGYDTFQNIPEAFRPSPSGPVDDGYLVGPNDELRLTVWGGAEFQYDLTVDREGRVYIPNVGQFTVAGKRLDTLRREMREWLSRDYAGLTGDPPSIFMDLTVTRVRPIQVFVLGEVAQPGGYTVSSYSTVFNVLYSVGGPLTRGSLRVVRVIRNGRVIANVDVYNYLLRGYEPDPIRLQSNDYIFIPPRGTTVAITGPVRRPAYYEMKEDETFIDLLAYAGGLQPEAYTEHFQIDRIVPFDERTDASVARRVLDLNLNDVRSGDQPVQLADGDRVRIRSIREADDRAAASRIEAVSVAGAVFQPGRYELGPDLRTVRDLIEHADGLTGDAYRTRAELIRLEDNLDESVTALDLNQVMADEPTANVVLRPQDSLWIASVQELETEREVRISGRVRNPGTYPYREGMTVSDLLFAGGGLADTEYLKDVFLGRADLYRQSEDGRTERIIPFHLGDALNGEGLADEALQPGDEVRVYPLNVEVLQERFVYISGAVKSPGRFRFRDNLTLKDLIIQAGGFEEGAHLKEVEVTRLPEERAGGNRATTLNVSLSAVTSHGTNGTDGTNGSNGAYDMYGEASVSFEVNESTALSEADEFQLEHRDRVYVRFDPNFEEQRTVMIRGEVQFPGEYTLLAENERLSDVIRRAGGVLPTGYPKGGRLFRDSSQVIIEMAEALAGQRDSDVILLPGDDVFIPPQPNTVAIRGNVANEGLIKYEPGRRVSYYLDRAGGKLKETEAIYLTQASGATFEVKTGWFRRTPEVDDGAVIRVTRKPPEPEGESIDIGETITDVAAILSSALTIIVLGQRALE